MDPTPFRLPADPGAEGGDAAAPLAERIARAIWAGDLTIHDLVTIGEVLRRKHAALRQIRTHVAMLALRPGMEVEWESPRHGVGRGTVVEVKRTRAVVCMKGEHYSVAASMLRPASGPSDGKPESRSC